MRIQDGEKLDSDSILLDTKSAEIKELGGVVERP